MKPPVPLSENDCLRSLTQEEYDELVGLPEEIIREALQKGLEDMRRVLAARRKPPGRY